MRRRAASMIKCRTASDYGFLHLAAAAAVRWWTGQLPCRKTGALRLPPERIAVAAERCMEYTALSTGCNARRALLTALGVTARFAARPGCIARRTLRGTSNLEKKPMYTPYSGEYSGRAASIYIWSAKQLGKLIDPQAVGTPRITVDPCRARPVVCGRTSPSARSAA